MSQRPLVIANWKMNLTLTESRRLAMVYRRLDLSRLDVVIAPSAPALPAVGQIIRRNRRLSLGAQQIAWADRGAYTGEVSPLILRELGCRYVIIGHSERKVYFHETMTDIADRFRAALAHDLIPIVCVGESDAEHRGGQSDRIIGAQVDALLSPLPPPLRRKPIIISYEPFWTISTSGGKLPSSTELAHRARVIWQAATDALGSPSATDHLRVIYGGTINADTVGVVSDIPEISGLLVGSASLHRATFESLIKQVG